MMLIAFLVALVPTVYGAACGPCDIVGYYDDLGQSSDCDFSQVTLDCDGGDAITSQADASFKAICENEAMKDQFQDMLTTAAKTYQDAITDGGIDCDAVSGGNNANTGQQNAAADATPSPTKADESAANGVVYKFAIFVSAFAYFLF